MWLNPIRGPKIGPFPTPPPPPSPNQWYNKTNTGTENKSEIIIKTYYLRYMKTVQGILSNRFDFQV